MGNIPSDMTSLCEDIATAHGDRKRSIKDLKEQAENIRDNARKFVKDCRKLNEEMAKKN